MRKSIIILLVLILMVIPIIASGQSISPFTGQPVDNLSRERALMVSVENSRQARPQSGLAEAEIVYEFLVEGGITRFLALYWDNIPEKIGPVRSVRPYMIRTARDYNAILLHAGASPQGFAILAQGDIEHLDQIDYKNKGYYWRDNDRNPPHNLYTGYPELRSYLQHITGWEYDPRFPFQYISMVSEDKVQAKKIEVVFWGGNKVIYKYNPERNMYYRYLGDEEEPHLTAANQHLAAKNILVRYVNTNIIDDIGRLSMDLEGSGDFLLFRDGIIIKGIWKDQGEGWTTYYKPDGTKVRFNPGKTWIEVIPQSGQVKYKG